jgi:hypothetical protein
MLIFNANSKKLFNATTTVKSCDMGTGSVFCPNGAGFNNVQGYTVYCCSANNCNEASKVAAISKSFVILSILVSSVVANFLLAIRYH